MQNFKKIWFNGKLIPEQNATIHVLSHALHYGTGVFEGIRMYQTPHGPAIFRRDAHLQRFLKSAAALAMPLPFTEKQLTTAVIATVKANQLSACYIRPIAFYGRGAMGLVPSGCPIEVAIAAWPWGALLSEDPVRIKIIDDISLSAQGSLTGAKISGRYYLSMYAAQKAQAQGYDEALLLDENGNVAEGPGENFFMVKNGLISTPTLGAILPGITRSSLIFMARNLGYQVRERIIRPKEIFKADECFFTGTAAEIAPIRAINRTKIRHAPGPVTLKLKAKFTTVTRGEDPKYKKWLKFV